MKRREFLSLLACVAAARAQEPEVVIERAAAGKPHAGKVLGVIQPHSDDITIFAAGAVVKLINEGYTGYMIRVTNDDMAGPGTYGDTVLANERDNDEVSRALGCKQVFNLNYNNHFMDHVPISELRARFIFLFRFLKVDTIVCYDPWGHYEENPDHYVTARAVESACWMAGGSKDYPEHFAAGLKAHPVREKYYFARGPQLVNRIVDTTSTVERKIDALLLNKAQGPAGEAGSRLRRSLAEKGLRIPALGTDDRTANREFIRKYVLARDAETGRKHGLAFAEAYHYIGPAETLDDIIKRDAVPAR